MRSPDLLILAAGMGSRYGGLKQLEPFGPGGETIMDYSVFDAVRAGYKKAVFVIRKDFAEAFETTVAVRFRGHIEVVPVFQDLQDLPAGFSVPEGRTKPWGTVHAILSARQQLGGPFVMINADDFYGAASFKVMADFYAGLPEGSHGRYSMAAYTLRDVLADSGTVTRGICRMDAKLMLTQVEEIKGISHDGHGAKAKLSDGKDFFFTGDELTSMNFFGFTPDLFAELEELFTAFLRAQGRELTAELLIPTAVNSLIKQKKASLQVLNGSKVWFGVTNPEDKPKVVANILGLVKAGQYPERLFP